MPTPFNRIHPLVAVAAVSVTLVSGLGIAALTGVLPASHGLAIDSQQGAADPVFNQANQPAVKPPLPVHAKTVTPQKLATNTQEKSVDATSVPPAQHKPVAQNSPVGIGVGALIGGVIGNQFGSGDGKTLATVAGAIGGGYVGNEVAKKNQAQP
jgi:uncharacterized protein YcfJ